MSISFSPILAPLISTALFMLGNGYLNSFISIRMSELGHSEQVIGIVASAYYVGLVLGALQIAKFIYNLGHLRVFAIFIGLFNCVALTHAISDNIYLWFILRLLAGLSLAGFYVTIESWLLEYTTNKNRGSILALYMISIASAQAFGQLLLGKYTGILPFIVVAILLSLSVIPVIASNGKNTKSHEIELINFRTLYKVASSSIFSCFVSGLILSAIYSLLPLVFERISIHPNETAYLMFVTLLGGMILQYPIGLLSDNFDRRKVLICVASLMIISLLTLIFFGHNNFSFDQLTVIYFIFGGMSFSFYPVALSMVCDTMRPGHVVSVSQGLSMIEGIGSIIGPVIAPPFMRTFGADKGLSVYFSIITVCLVIFLVRRIFKHERISHNHFVLAVHTTPVAAELDPRGEEIHEEEIKKEHESS
jgi:MFS family permease